MLMEGMVRGVCECVCVCVCVSECVCGCTVLLGEEMGVTGMYRKESF